MTAPIGLSVIALPMLELLLTSIESGRLDCPLTEVDLAEAGFPARSRDVCTALRDLDAKGATAALRIAIAERVHRPPPRLDLVWTGPETRASTAKSTSLVVANLFNSATRSVLVGGYAFDRAEILEPLHRGMKERGVTVTMFVDIEGTADRIEDAAAHATRFIDKFFHRVWTFGTPKPDVYYDPRTAVKGPPWASLHAKCIIVDDERTLVTSANFTDRGQQRNIEAGVLIEDRGYSEDLAGHWRQLVTEGFVLRYVG